MSTGVIVLFFTVVIIYIGVTQRVLDHLYLTDTSALIIIASMIAGSFIDITLSRNPLITVNIGGAIIPLLLVIYILIKTDTNKEVFRSLGAALATFLSIYVVTIIFRNFGEGRDIIDPMYLFVLLGGISGYVFGRSRRGAFIAGTLGFLLYNLLNIWRLLSGRLITEIHIGGGGVLDSIVISGFFALLLAEIFGETRENILNNHKQGGNN